MVAKMKPRTGDGPLEVLKETRNYIMRMPVEGGGRVVFELDPAEAEAMRAAFVKAVPEPAPTASPEAA